MRDIRAVMQRWGEWAAHEENRPAWPTVCATFRGVLRAKSAHRPSCSDDDGLIIDACVSRLHIQMKCAMLCNHMRQYEN